MNISIANHLRRIRRAAIKTDLMALAWQVYAFILFLLILSIPVEVVLYLSAATRLTLWLTLFLVTTAGVISLLIIAVSIQRNRYQPYRWTSLARRVGELTFARPDTVVNALQLERSLKSSLSRELSRSFITHVSKILEQVDVAVLFPRQATKRWKIRTIILLITALTVLITWNDSKAAIYRWSHPRTEFPVPKPFALKSLTGDTHLLGGESVAINIESIWAQPDTVFLELTIPYSSEMDSPPSVPVVYSTAIDSSGRYSFALNTIYQDYIYRAFVPARHFWQPWKEVSSPAYRILVTDRPTIENFTITIIPPSYSGLEPQIQQANQANVPGLKGSMIAIQLTSNRPLEKSYLNLNGEVIDLESRGYHVAGEFTLTDDGIFTVHLVDRRGITNRDPIPYHLQLIPDRVPELNVILPPPVVELGSDQLIPIHLNIEDDFGFSNLQVGYEIRRPSYLNTDPFISMFKIPDLDTHQLSQEIQAFWDLSELGLMPEDEVHYHFELYDNDDVSGPKKTLSGTFIARLPSLADLYTALENDQYAVLEEAEINVADFELLQEHLERAELDLLKSNALDWEQQQAIKKTLEKTRQELEQLQKLKENLEILTEGAEKHGLFSPALMEKFKELQELVNDLITAEFLKSMQRIEEALMNMDQKDLMLAMEQLTQNMEQLERDLERFIDIFRRIQAEQKLEEVINRLQRLTEQQAALTDKILKADEKTDPSTFVRWSQEEKWNWEEFQHIQAAMREASKLMEEYHAPSAQALEELEQSELTEQTEANLSQAQKQLNKLNPATAQTASQAALQNLQTMQRRALDIQEQFQQATATEMAVKFQAVMRDVLTLSKAQEALEETTRRTPRNSPRIRSLAGNQQMLKDQLAQIMSAMLELSTETFAITPDMGKSFGMAFAAMEAAKTKLAERNSSGARSSQETAMKSLNEGALLIYNASQQMQMGGSASGFEQFLEQMQQLTGQQQGINQQSLQLALGQMAAAAREALFQRLLQKQQQVRKALRQLLKEMQTSGNQGLGDMSGIAREMDEVLKDFKRKQFTRQTSERQQRILSRMLDSQKSLTQRGFKEERLSRTGRPLVSYSGPAGLPAALGQRRSLALEALNEALKAGYSRDYQAMIRRYFNVLSQTELNESAEDSQPVFNPVVPADTKEPSQD